ncbi:MAG: IS200/IS605 family transposase [Planctomycetes bacterium]|nr:IS200/IS605 family transposase [Planctomycetota bacterium]
MSLISGNHIKYQLTYHLQWCTKYRYRVLNRDVYRLDYENRIRNTARNYGIEIIELSVLPEHVHALVSAPPTITVSQILQYLKGAIVSNSSGCIL